MTFGAAILAGGESSRMGRDKASLTYNGTPFLSILSKELSGWGELLLSCASPRENSYGLTEVCDQFHGLGPMAGLSACLEACKSDALLFVPCDLPLFTKELGDYLCSQLTDEYDAVIAVSFSGLENPLCAVYRKSTAPVFKEALSQGRSRIFDVFGQLRIRKVPIWEAGFADRLMANINSPAEYACLCGAAIKNIFLTGASGSGKSSVIEITAELLKKRVGGFVTTFLKDRSGNTSLYMLAPEETMADMSAHVVAACNNDPQPNVERFNSLGTAYLSDEDAELFIMDELGSLETGALDFRRAVNRALESPVPVLGAFHDTLSGWTQDISHRCDVRVISVTPDNRETLPVVLANMISSMRPHPAVTQPINAGDAPSRRAV